jgi:hypothetical protein
MATFLWVLGAWALISLPLGLLIGRGIKHVNPPCKIADAPDWDDVRVILFSSLANREGRSAQGLWATADAEADLSAHALPAARKVA